MKQIFVDTSAWDALADKKDQDHTNAIRLRGKIAGKYKLVTSNYILDELYTLLLMNVGYLPTVNSIFTLTLCTNLCIFSLIMYKTNRVLL